MWSKPRTVVVLALLSAAPIGSSVVEAAGPTEAAAAVSGNRPARVEAISGSNTKKIVLTPKAAQRVDIQTGKVWQDTAGRKIVPYAAVVYDKDGGTWVYTNPESLTFTRQKIHIVEIKGDDAVLKEGPDVGTLVATTGAPQLYGAEKGVGH